MTDRPDMLASSSTPRATSVKNGLATSRTTRPIVRLRPARSWRADSFLTNPSALIAAFTRSRVNAAIKALGFVRNESARQLRAGRSRTIGLVVLDVANPFFTDVARGVEDEASMSGLAVILCNSDDQQAKETHYLELLEEHRVQGILITPVPGAHDRLAQLQRRGTPVVLVDSRSPTHGQCSVAVDDVLGGDLAVTHLLGQQHE